MTTYEQMKMNYLRASFLQAKEDGKLVQWFVTRGLLWLLRMVLTLIFVAPLKLIWRLTGRRSEGVAHVLKFCLGALLYFCFLYALIAVTFMRSSSSANGQSSTANEKSESLS